MTLAEFLTYLSQGGVTGLLALAYWNERKERLSERSKNEELSREMITAMVKTDHTLEKIGGILMLGKPAQ